MPELDTHLRTIADALVDEAPPPPPWPSDPVVRALPPRRHRGRVVIAAAALLATLAGTALRNNKDAPTRIHTSAGSEASQPSTCSADPPLRVSVLGATDGPFVGPAPGGAAALDGQRVLHWLRADGSVELRWPARSAPLYDDGTVPHSTLPASESVSPRRAEIDVDPTTNPADPGAVSEPDLIIEPHDFVPSPPCDLLQVSITTNAGHWSSGMRATGLESDTGGPYERVDLQARIVERRSVAVAPAEAVRCRGSDRSGTPPNRSGGPDPTMAASEPAQVLLQYLAANPGAPSSGYVEMIAPDGSITYGVDPHRDGWTTLIFVGSDRDGWRLEGWKASGC